MTTMNFNMTEAVSLLRRTPHALHGLLEGLPEPWLSATEGTETWSPRDVVAHLADLEDTDWMVRVNAILRDGTSKPFVPIDRVGFRHTLAGCSIDELLDLFAERRGRNLRELHALELTPAQLALKGLHPDPTFGQVTLGALLSTWVVHDLTHLTQISRVMAKRYDTDVGPWKAYLSVLTR